MQDVAGYHNIQSLLGLSMIFLFTFQFKKCCQHSGQRNISDPNNLTSLMLHLFGIYIPLSPDDDRDEQNTFPPQSPGTGMIYDLGEIKIKTNLWVKWSEVKRYSKYFSASDIWASRISFCWAEYLLSGFSLTVGCGCFLILLTSRSCIEITSCSKIRAGPQSVLQRKQQL